MKKTVYLLVSLFCLILSCTKDDCHECHIAWSNSLGNEVEGEIGEFCGENLTDIEAHGYHLMQDLIIGNDTIVAGHYNASEIHCEEHAH